jgi:hypothetical protein
MKTKLFVVLTTAFLLFWSCQSGEKRSEQFTRSSSDESKEKTEYYSDQSSKTAELEESLVADSSGASEPASAEFMNKKNEAVSSSGTTADTAYLSLKMSQKKLIKTAELRFKVKNVEQTTATIEGIARKAGGYVVSSELRSTPFPWKSTTVEISGDSVLVVTEFEVSNQLVIRVPNYNYDSVLEQLRSLYSYLDYRILKTEDVTSQFLRNKLKAENKAKYEKRINAATDEKGRRLDDIVNAETNAATLADQAIDNKIANYELQDRIDYCMISLTIYQAHEISKERTANLRLSDYKPSFWRNAWNALVFGWDLLKYLVIGLLYIWSLVLLAVVILLVIRYFVKRAARKKQMKE